MARQTAQPWLRISNLEQVSASPRYLTDVSGTLFFRANDGVAGEEALEE